MRFNKREFFIFSVVIMYIYLAFIFQVNLKNFMNVRINPQAKFTINILNL